MSKRLNVFEDDSDFEDKDDDDAFFADVAMASKNTRGNRLSSKRIQSQIAASQGTRSQEPVRRQNAIMLVNFIPNVFTLYFSLKRW